MMHLPGRLRSVPLSRQELALIAITTVWGGTFLAVHIAMRHSGPMFFVGLRFLVAGLLACVLFRRVLRGMTWADAGAGAAIGVMIFLGYGLQTFGLQTVSSSTSAFLTALYVPMVPFLQWAVFRKRPGAMMFAGAALAFVGLVLLAGPSAVRVGVGPGEIATLVSTVPIAGEIILISVFAGRVNLGRVTVVQLLTCSVLGFIAVPVVREGIPAFSWVWVATAAGLGAASCVIQATMNWAQKFVTPTRATIIYTGEPVWAGIFGRIAGDRLPGVAIAGAVLIVASVLVSEIRPRPRPRQRTPGDSRVVDLPPRDRTQHD
ncbi:DMT family transporter [Arthrobacter sp. SDTb3-6]|uniref:DMT family transporter n=1 Tax=Arthrobacter sp. SDTb3-6 TaxID=2713571 RepID=UPI00159D2127|nr:DMT family transporter [Arthrobacter sp. SDTb3-6]NVM97613.1 DMT family transporter [Arthrobacter sp. SDTb3-6]